MKKISLETILISALIIVALFVSIYFPFKFKQLSNDFLEQTSHYGELLNQINNLQKEVRELKNGNGEVDDLKDWQTYMNNYGNFEFHYPAEYNLRDFISWSNIDFNKDKVNFGIGADDINNVLYADSSCGMVSQELYQEQKKALENAIADYSFDLEFEKTDYKIRYSKVFINSNEVKIAYGISICQGMASENDLGILKYTAIAFNKDMRIGISFSLTEKQSGNIKIKDLQLRSKEISGGKYNGKAQDIYNNFLEILNSLQFFNL